MVDYEDYYGYGDSEPCSKTTCTRCGGDPRGDGIYTPVCYCYDVDESSNDVDELGWDEQN